MLYYYFIHMYAVEFQVSRCETSQGKTGMCSAERQELQCTISLHMQYSEKACSVYTGYMFIGTLVVIKKSCVYAINIMHYALVAHV